jgi:hypothetical protein
MLYSERQATEAVGARPSDGLSGTFGPAESRTQTSARASTAQASAQRRPGGPQAVQGAADTAGVPAMWWLTVRRRTFHRRPWPSCPSCPWAAWVPRADSCAAHITLHACACHGDGQHSLLLRLHVLVLVGGCGCHLLFRVLVGVLLAALFVQVANVPELRVCPERSGPSAAPAAREP